jgi:hypothetical protein
MYGLRRISPAKMNPAVHAYIPNVENIHMKPCGAYTDTKILHRYQNCIKNNPTDQFLASFSCHSAPAGCQEGSENQQK